MNLRASVKPGSAQMTSLLPAGGHALVKSFVPLQLELGEAFQITPD